MNISVVIPAYNEEESLSDTVLPLHRTLTDARISHEIIIVDDHSTDRTLALASQLSQSIPQIRALSNDSMPRGFGNAVKTGLNAFAGDAVIIYMADGSDREEDVIKYYQCLLKADCAFGSRFLKGSRVANYPLLKLALNRFLNLSLKCVWDWRYNDFSNAFKGYRRHVIADLQPLTSEHFNLTLELPLKALKKGYSFKVVPISWQDRRHGRSNLKVLKMAPLYLKTIFNCL